MCNLFQCRNLPPADSNGSADPYVKFYCNGSKNQTKPGDKMCTLNPQYYEMVPLQIEISRVELAPPIIISVWDYDTFSSDDLMGVCIVDLAKASFD